MILLVASAQKLKTQTSRAQKSRVWCQFYLTRAVEWPGIRLDLNFACLYEFKGLGFVWIQEVTRIFPSIGFNTTVENHRILHMMILRWPPMAMQQVIKLGLCAAQWDKNEKIGQ